MAVKEVHTSVNVDARRKLGIMPGDTVRVSQKIQEKGKTRLQAFEGLVLATKHGTEPGATFTVRKVASGVGVEKIFPLFSPMIDKIEIVKRTKVRRAKLYYIRDKAAKEIRRSMRNAYMVGDAIESDIAEKERLVREAEQAENARAEEETSVAEKEEEVREVVEKAEPEKQMARDGSEGATVDEKGVSEEESEKPQESERA